MKKNICDKYKNKSMIDFIKFLKTDFFFKQDKEDNNKNWRYNQKLKIKGRYKKNWAAVHP